MAHLAWIARSMFLIVSCLPGEKANAANAWVCTYPGYPSGTSTIIKLYVEGDSLLEAGRSLDGKRDVLIKYQLLKNDAGGLVAVLPITNSDIVEGIDVSDIIPTVSAYVIAIKKNTLDFIILSAFVSAIATGTSSGHCVNN